MTNLRHILAEHHLGVERFTELIGTTLKSIHKYEKGDITLKASTKARIEHGLYLVEQSGIVWPIPTDIIRPYDFSYGASKYREEVRKCNQQFKDFVKEFEGAN